MGAGAAAAAAAAVLKAHYRDLLRAVAGVLAPACLLFFGGAAAGGILPRHEFQQVRGRWARGASGGRQG